MKLIAVTLAVALALLTGCVTLTRESATTSRFVAAKQASVKGEIERAFTAAGWKQMEDGRWQRTLIRRHDPIIGVIVISEEPQLAARLSISYVENNGGTLVEAYAVMANRHTYGGGYGEYPMRDHSETDALIDSAIARAQFTAAAK